MTITVERTPDQERKLSEAAREQGKDIAEFLEHSVEQRLRKDP